MDEVDSIGMPRLGRRRRSGGDSAKCSARCSSCSTNSTVLRRRIRSRSSWRRTASIFSIKRCPAVFDREIEFPNLPDDSRYDILKIHSRKMNLVRGIDLKKIASKMNGASGAESKAVCTEGVRLLLLESVGFTPTKRTLKWLFPKVMQKDSEKNISVKKLFS